MSKYILLQGKFNNVWDEGMTIKLLVKFLKKHHMMDRLYHYFSISESSPLLTISHSYPSINNIGRTYIRWVGYYASSHIEQEDLVLSQLWKFYVLERIDMYGDNVERKKEIEKHLKHQLECNGFRDNEEIKKLFEKYNLNNLKDKHH